MQNDETLLRQIRKQVNKISFEGEEENRLEGVNFFRYFSLLKRIIKIYNRYTHEEMLYNYMRSQRPQTKSEISPEN